MIISEYVRWMLYTILDIPTINLDYLPYTPQSDMDTPHTMGPAMDDVHCEAKKSRRLEAFELCLGTEW